MTWLWFMILCGDEACADLLWEIFGHPCGDGWSGQDDRREDASTSWQTS